MTRITIDGRSFYARSVEAVQVDGDDLTISIRGGEVIHLHKADYPAKTEQLLLAATSPFSQVEGDIVITKLA
jgi:flagellar biogenesis protein FliO